VCGEAALMMGAAARMKFCQSDISRGESQAGGGGIRFVNDHEVIGLIAGGQYLVFRERLRLKLRES
jgi:hypothetical protein